uniref:Uncharacterized protein n=1 Tax=Glossina pallidipes TaxID=7398 RepID=A0A1B0AJL7_GLOPL
MAYYKLHQNVIAPIQCLHAKQDIMGSRQQVKILCAKSNTDTLDNGNVHSDVINSDHFYDKALMTPRIYYATIAVVLIYSDLLSLLYHKEIFRDISKPNLFGLISIKLRNSKINANYNK